MKDENILYKKALSLINKGDLREALLALSSIEKEPPTLRVLCAKGSIYWNLRQLPETASCLLKAIEYYPDNELSILSFFQNLLDRTQSDLPKKESMQALTFANTKEYDSFRATFYTKYALLTNDYHQRVVLLEHATKANPNAADAFMELGISYRHIREMEKAEIALKKSISINDDGMARLFLGHVFFSVELWDLAEKEFISAQKHFPKYAAPIWAQADVYRQRGNPEKSLQLYRAAVEEQPDNAEALARLGRALLENDKRVEGAKYLQMALEKNPACEVALKWKKQFNIGTEA